MKTFTHSIILILFTLTPLLHDLTAQECGTHPTEKDIQYLQRIIPITTQLKHNKSHFDFSNTIPVKVYIIRKSDGTGGLTDTGFESAMKSLNNRFSDAGLEFSICEKIYVDSDDFNDFNADLNGDNDEFEIIKEYYTQGVINLYCADNMRSQSGSSICGYAYLPGSTIDRIFMNNACMLNGSTLAHEFGHYFGLLHTHETNWGVDGAELVDGSNCQTAGDLICDTPADPNLIGNGRYKVDANCKYFGTDRDANGELYQPDVHNLMSYSRKECRDKFSPLQMNVMNYIAQNERSYLHCDIPQELSRCEEAILIECGVTYEGSTIINENRFGVEDYNCYTGSKTYEGADNLFTFDLQYNADVSISITNLTEDLDFFVFSACNEQNTCIGASVLAGKYNQQLSLTNLTGGTYYIVIDAHETGITGNFALRIDCQEILQPNLVCSNPGNLSIKNNQLNISGLVIKNIGNSKARSSRIAYLLSEDKEITMEDTYLGNDYVYPLSPNRTSTESFRFPVSNLPEGEHYVGVLIDYQDVVEESEEGDNICLYTTKLIIGSPAEEECKCSTMSAHSICDDFQSYSLNDGLGEQSDCWTTWSGNEGGPEDGIVSGTNDGNKYLAMSRNVTNGIGQDVVLQLGDKASGSYLLTFYLFAYDGEKAYFNLLHQFEPSGTNNEWAQEVFFLGNGNGILRASGGEVGFNYRPRSWTAINQLIDLDNDITILFINGKEVHRWTFSDQALGGQGLNVLSAINFFKVDRDYRFFVDNFDLRPFNSTITDTPDELMVNQLPAFGPLDVDKELSGQSHYEWAETDLSLTLFPNPATNWTKLKLGIHKYSQVEITVKNTFGQMVYHQLYTLNGESLVNLDLNQFAGGVYFVTVNVGGIKETKRLIVK